MNQIMTNEKWVDITISIRLKLVAWGSRVYYFTEGNPFFNVDVCSLGSLLAPVSWMEKILNESNSCSNHPLFASYLKEGKHILKEQSMFPKDKIWSPKHPTTS